GGWGDGARGRAYSIAADGSIVFQSLAGVKPFPPGLSRPISSVGNRGDVLGVHYHRFHLVLLADDRTPLPGTYGTQTELRIGLRWPLLLAAAFSSLCVTRLIKQRRLGRGPQYCRNCRSEERRVGKEGRIGVAA